MSVPVPGVRSSAALAALAAPQRRVHFAHADLSAYSVFEEAPSLHAPPARPAAAAPTPPSPRTGGGRGEYSSNQAGSTNTDLCPQGRGPPRAGRY